VGIAVENARKRLIGTFVPRTIGRKWGHSELQAVSKLRRHEILNVPISYAHTSIRMLDESKGSQARVSHFVSRAAALGEPFHLVSRFAWSEGRRRPLYPE
jgi:hypothetical protein